jgi:hypothetical protein
LALLYVGAIGAGLHPSLTGTELSDGPLKGDAATRRESLAIPAQEKYFLVSRACTHVAVLVTLMLLPYLMGQLGWRWYVSLAVAFWGATFLGGVLKYAYGYRLRRHV